MITLFPKTNITSNSFHFNNVKRFVQICKDSGYDLSQKSAYIIWKAYSDDLCASWIYPPENDADVLDILLEYSSQEMDSSYLSM